LFLSLKEEYVELLDLICEEEKEFFKKLDEKVKLLNLKPLMKKKQYLCLDEFLEERTIYENIKVRKRKATIGFENVLNVLAMNLDIVKERKSIDHFSLTREDKMRLQIVEKEMEFFSLPQFSFQNANLSLDVANYMSHIQEMLQSYSFVEQKYFATLFRRLLKEKAKEFRKNGDKKEASIVKMVRDMLKSYLTNMQEVNDVHYDILISFLDSNFNYAYVKALLEEIPEFRSIRKEEHILFEILDRYSKNVKLKLVNQGFEYVDPTYFFKVFELFFENENDLTDEEKNALHLKIDDIKEYIIDHKYKDVDKALNELERMSFLTDEQYVASSYQNPKIDKNYCQIQMSDFANKKRADYTSGYMRKLRDVVGQVDALPENEKEAARMLSLNVVDYQNALYSSDVFMFENGKYAYSLSYSDVGETYFRVHTLDMRFVEEGSNLETILRENALHLKDCKFISMKKNQVYPTITYQFKLESDGTLNKLKYFESKIDVSKVYKTSDLLEYKSNRELKELISVLRKMDFSENLSISAIEEFMQREISENVLQVISDRPFLFRQVVDNNEELLLQNHYAICELLMKLSKEESNHINEIIHRPLAYTYSSEAAVLSHIDMNSPYLELLFQRGLFHPLDLEFVEQEVNAFNDMFGYVPLHFLKNEKYFQKRIDKNE
jgi:hypothetical protein